MNIIQWKGQDYTIDENEIKAAIRLNDMERKCIVWLCLCHNINPCIGKNPIYKLMECQPEYVDSILPKVRMEGKHTLLTFDELSALMAISNIALWGMDSEQIKHIPKEMFELFPMKPDDVGKGKIEKFFVNFPVRGENHPDDEDYFRYEYWKMTKEGK